MDQDFVDDFPVSKLNQFNEKISGPRLTSIVLPGGELEILLDAAIDCYKRGVNSKSEACQSFIREGLPITFFRLLKTELDSSFTSKIHKCTFHNAQKLIDLIVLQLKQAELPLLEILAILFDPMSTFHAINASSLPKSYNPETPPPEEELFARHIKTLSPKGWLVDLINRFGTQGGFVVLLEAFYSPKLHRSHFVVHALLKPFANCVQFLTRPTVERYFLPIYIKEGEFLAHLGGNDANMGSSEIHITSTVYKYFQSFKDRVPDCDAKLKNGVNLEYLRLILSSRMVQAIAEERLDKATEKTLQPLNNLLEDLAKKERTITVLANARRDEIKKNTQLLEKLSTTTEKIQVFKDQVKHSENKYELELQEVALLKETNRVLEERVRYLKNKYELDLKEVALLKETNQVLEEQVKHLENKYELDLKQVPLLKEANQKLTTKVNEMQSFFQQWSSDIQSVVKSEPSILPTALTASTENKEQKASPSQTEHENEHEEQNVSPVKEEVAVVKPESPVASSSSSTCLYFDHFKFFEENKNNLAVKILEKLSTCHLLDVRLVSKNLNELIIPILHQHKNLILDFSYRKQQNVHPLTRDLSIQKSLWQTLSQFNKVLQTATIIAEKSLQDSPSTFYIWQIPCIRFSFDLLNISKTDFNKGALFKFFTSHLNNFSSLKQLTLTETDGYLNSKMQQEHHEIIVKILNKTCDKVEHLDISGLYSVSNRSGIEISSSSPDQYFSKLESLKTNGNLMAVNGWIVSSAPVLKSVELSEYRNLESLKIFEKHGCLDLIQRLEMKIPTILSLAHLESLQQLHIFQLNKLKSIKVWAEKSKNGEGCRNQGKEPNKNMKEFVINTEIPSIIARMLKAVENSIEILECGNGPLCCSRHPVQYPEVPKLHTLKYIKDAGLCGVGFLSNSSEFDGRFQNLTTIIFDLDYASDDWLSFVCGGGKIPSVQSLEISNESFIRKESDQNLGNMAASFPNLKRFKSCDPHRLLTQTCFIKSIWKHLKKLESLELTLGKKAALNGAPHTVDSTITGLSLSSCSQMYDCTSNSSTSFTSSQKEPSIIHLQVLKRFALHLDDLSSLTCRNNDYPLLSKVTGQFIFHRMPKLRVQICVPTSLVEKARETSIYPFVDFVGEE